MTESSAGKSRDPALTAAHSLGEILGGIRATKDKPSPELMSWVEERVGMVRDALLEPDPVRQRAYLIVIALRQSTMVREYESFGRMVKEVVITDHDLYRWLVTESHKMPERFL